MSTEPDRVLRLLGSISMAISALLFAVTIAVLRYDHYFPGSFWKVDQTDAIVLTVLSVGVIVSAAVSAFVNVAFLTAVACLASVFLFAQYFVVEGTYRGYAAGFWVPSAVAFLGLLGAFVTLLGTLAVGRGEAVGSEARLEPTHPPSGAPARSAAREPTVSQFEPAPRAVASAPAGWYPDPLQEAQLRFWNGAEWMDATQP